MLLLLLQRIQRCRSDLFVFWKQQHSLQCMHAWSPLSDWISTVQSEARKAFGQILDNNLIHLTVDPNLGPAQSVRCRNGIYRASNSKYNTAWFTHTLWPVIMVMVIHPISIEIIYMNRTHMHPRSQSLCGPRPVFQNFVGGISRPLYLTRTRFKSSRPVIAFALMVMYSSFGSTHAVCKRQVRYFYWWNVHKLLWKTVFGGTGSLPVLLVIVIW